MTNLEFYKDEIVEIKKREENRILECLLREMQTKSYDCEVCAQCLKESLDWLLEEHKEPIKLKKWEYDLLFFYSCNSLAKFKDSSILSKMKEKGHFKGITDTSMTLQDILDNCEVVE